MCPECGAKIGAPLDASPDETLRVLLAVCDVLVVKALEKMGTYIIRSGATRGRWAEFDRTALPQYAAHTIWPATDMIVSRALKNAWDVVPLILETHGPGGFDAELVTRTLDQYVHDLAITGTLHNFNDLAYRVRHGLGLPVFHITPVTD